MKIISKIKDYYDFVIWKTWIDNKVVYERIPEIILEKDSSFDYYIDWIKDLKWWKFAIIELIAFCWNFVSFAFYNWKFHFWKDIDLDELNKEFSFQKNDFFWTYHSIEDLKNLRKRNEFYKSLHWKNTNINDNYSSPSILLRHKIKYTYHFDEEKLIPIAKNLILWDYWFGSFMKPEEVYNKIYNFLIKEKDIPSIQTNENKIVSHWFNLKKSFRSNNK